VIRPDEIVPFFIKVDCDGQRLFEIVQVPLNQANAEEIAHSLVSDLGITNGFHDQIESLVLSELADFQKTATRIPATEWALENSAVHKLNLEVGLDSVVYSDYLEWDIFDDTADPDEFARRTVKELALPVEFVNVISAQIRWQVIRLRAMHCYVERFKRFIEDDPFYAPQTQRGLRTRSELFDWSPGVSLVPGVTAKKAIASRDRHARHLKRLGHTVARGALQPADDPGEINVKGMVIVRAAPMPEDSGNLDLAEIPAMLSDDRYENMDIVSKVERKFASPLMLSQHHPCDDSGSDSGGEA
jgi:hypothetical protein